MARHEDLITRRTKKEREAYLQGFATAIEMVKRHGIANAQLMLSVTQDLVAEHDGGGGSERGETRLEIARPSAFLSPDSENEARGENPGC